MFNWPETPEIGLDNGTDTSQLDSQRPNGTHLDPLPIRVDLANDQLGEIQQRVVDGDNYLDVGSNLAALKCYHSVLSFYRDNPAFALRMALANELSGQTSRAEKTYLGVLRKIADNDVLRLYAILGIVRCKYSLGQFRSANELLCENLLTSIDARDTPKYLESEVCLQLVKLRQQAVENLIVDKTSVLNRPIFEEFPTEGSALIETLKSIAPIYPKSIDSNLVEAKLEPRLSVSRDDANLNLEELKVGEVAKRQLSLIQKPNDDVRLMVVAGTTGTIFVKDFLNRIASLTELDIPIDERIAPFLLGRTAKFDNSSLSVALLLDCLLAPIDLAWRQHNNQIELLPLDSMDARDLRDYLASQAIRAGRYFVLNYPDSRRKNTLRVTISNLNFATGQLDVALKQLTQLQDESAHVDLAAKIEFDLGLLEAKFNRLESAIELFMAAIDQSNSNYVKSIAYANVGRIQLQRGAIEPAKIASSRSLMLFNDVEVQQQAALDLARAYLLSNNPLSANQTLYQHASVIAGSKIEAIALVYGAYARTLGTLSPLDKKKALKTLIIALAGVKIKDIKLPVDRILIAKAFVRSGLLDRAIDILEQESASSMLLGWNRDQVYELALLLEQNGQIDSALKHYHELASLDNGYIGQYSILRIAMLELYEKKSPEGCLENCAKLWQLNLADEEKSKILRLMGQAYSKIGNHELATYCFLGMLPDDVSWQDGKAKATAIRDFGG